MIKLVHLAGHGGNDNGCTAYDGSFEKKYTHMHANLVHRIIKKYYNNSIILNPDDKNYSSTKRITDIKSQGKCIVFDWHYNAYNKKTRGIEVLISKSNKLHKEFAFNLCEKFSNKFGTYNRGAKIRDSKTRKFYPATARYMKNAYVEKDYYYMHRKTGAAKVFIIEPLFIDNPLDFKILDNAHLGASARFFAKEILEYFCGIQIYDTWKEILKKCLDYPEEMIEYIEFLDRQANDKADTGVSESGNYLSEMVEKVFKYGKGGKGV